MIFLIIFKSCTGLNFFLFFLLINLFYFLTITVTLNPFTWSVYLFFFCKLFLYSRAKVTSSISYQSRNKRLNKKIFGLRQGVYPFNINCLTTL